MYILGENFHFPMKNILEWQNSVMFVFFSVSLVSGKYGRITWRNLYKNDKLISGEANMVEFYHIWLYMAEF